MTKEDEYIPWLLFIVMLLLCFVINELTEQNQFLREQHKDCYEIVPPKKYGNINIERKDTTYTKELSTWESIEVVSPLLK